MNPISISKPLLLVVVSVVVATAGGITPVVGLTKQQNAGGGVRVKEETPLLPRFCFALSSASVFFPRPYIHDHDHNNDEEEAE